MTLDLRMPGLGGFDVIEYVRLAPDLSRTKILVVSALENVELDRARLLGADDILQKPLNPKSWPHASSASLESNCAHSRQATTNETIHPS